MTKHKSKGDDSDFKDFEKEVNQALKEYQKDSKVFKSSDDRVQISFLALGKKLVNAGNTLTRKTFKQLKDNTAKELGTNGIRNIDKVVSVAKATHLEKYTDRLPSSWGTLAVLTSLKPERLDEFMLDETITKEITRAELIKKIQAFKNPERVVKIRHLMIKPVNNENITDEDKSIIKTLLENSGWTLYEPKSKTSKEAIGE